ncbi:MAG: hypothetical protein V3U70_01995 [Thermoplasmata archaeon]
MTSYKSLYEKALKENRMLVGQLANAVVPPGPFFFQAQDGWKWDEQAGGIVVWQEPGEKAPGVGD